MKHDHQLQTNSAEVFNAYSETYSKTVDNAVGFTGFDVDFFTKVKVGYILHLVRKHFGASGALNVLDVGCGIGNFHKLLRPQFSSLDGVDVSASSIEKARSLNPDVTYRCSDGGRMPYDDGSFDIAFTVCVMHHVPPAERLSFLADMRRVIRPGGLALVFEHNPLNPLTMRVVNRCPFDEDAVLLRSGETVALLRNAGFGSVKPRFILSVPAGNALLRSIDRLFSLLPLGAQYYVAATKA